MPTRAMCRQVDEDHPLDTEVLLQPREQTGVVAQLPVGTAFGVSDAHFGSSDAEPGEQVLVEVHVVVHVAAAVGVAHAAPDEFVGDGVRVVLGRCGSRDRSLEPTLPRQMGIGHQPELGDRTVTCPLVRSSAVLMMRQISCGWLTLLNTAPLGFQ
jgi:hypothetical protein